MTDKVQSSETAMIKKIQKGNTHEFKKLYEIYSPRMFALTLRMTQDRSASEEITQEIFLRVWNKISSFNFNSSFYTWLYKLGINIIIRKSQILKKSKFNESDVEIENLYKNYDDRKIENIENKIDCERALLTLPYQARQVFILHDMEGYTHIEIEEMTGICVGASKAQLSRARTLLKKELKL